MRWIRARGLRSCWGCDLGMRVLRLGGFMIPKCFLRGYSFLRIRLWVYPNGGLFQSSNFTMVRWACCDGSKQVITVRIVHQFEASNVGADPRILPSSPHAFLWFLGFLNERVTITRILCFTSRLLPSNNHLSRNLFVAIEPFGHSIPLGSSFL